MATTNLAMKQYKQRRKKGGVTMSTSPKIQQQKLQNQVSNYETRLKNIGVDPEKAKDKRNWFEKLTNLPEGQNALFDFFELIGRPQQAIFGGVNNLIQGDDFVEGLKEGISGEKETSGGEILRNLGMSGSGEFNAFDPSSWDELSLSDVLGFGLDLFADPVDLVAGKAIKTAGKGIKKTIGAGDNLVEKGLTKLDDINANKIAKRVSQTGESVDDAARALKLSTNKLETYRDIKKQLSKMKNSSNNLMGLTGKAREAENVEEVISKLGNDTIRTFDNDIRTIVNRTAKTSDEAEKMYKKISDALMTNLEMDWDYSIKGKDVLDVLKKGKRIDFFNDESAKAISDALKEYGIKASSDGRYVTLLDDTKKLKNLTSDFTDKTFGDYLSVEDLLDRQEAEKLLNSSPELQDLANRTKTAYRNLANTSDTLTGLNSGKIADLGYGRHGITEEYKNLKQAQGNFTGANKTFKGRTFKGTTAEYNRIKRASLGDSADNLVDDAVNAGSKTTKKGKRAAESIYKTDEAGNFVRDSKGNLIRDDNLYNKKVLDQKNKIDRLKKQKESVSQFFETDEAGELLKDSNGNLIKKKLSDIDETKLSAKDRKNLNIIKAQEETKKIVTELETLNYNKIAPESSNVIDDLSTSLGDYKKARNDYINGLKKKNITDDELKVLKDNMNKQQKILSDNIRITKEYTNKQARDAVKNANKVFKESKKAGATLEKEMQKLARIQNQTNEIYKAATDLADSLPKQIKYEQAALNKIENSADAIFKSKSKIIEQEAKAANILTSQEGIEFMNTGFMENFIDYVNRSPEFNKGAQIYNEALATGIFNNKEYVKFAEDIGDKIPRGFVKVDGNQLAKNLDVYKGIIPKDSKDILNLAENFKGKTLYMDEDLARLTKLWSPNNTNSGVRSLLNLWDSMNNVFKKFSTLSLGFQERNIIGNSTNMVLSGVSAKELPGYYKKAGEIWNNADNLLKKAADGTLTATEKAQWETLQDFYKAGFLNAFEKGQGLEAIKSTKNPISKISKASVNANEWVDTHNRLALLMYAKDHPQYVKKLGKNNAVDAVKMVLFDPSNMSDFERNTLKRIIPFYTFTKQNLMFQADNIMRNTPRYNRLFKSINKAYDAIGEDSYYQYQKENMQIPLPFKDADGNQLFLKSNLPVSDLGEFLSKPIQRTAASASPIIRTPYELTSGKSTFTGEDANYKVLSGTLNKLGIKGQGIENTAQAAEAILNGFGLQNVSTNLIRKVSAVLDRDNDNISDQQLWAEIFRSVLQNTKQENVIQSGLYDELEEYQSIIKRLKNQGVDVPTMTQINQVNKMKLNKMKNKRARSN